MVLGWTAAVLLALLGILLIPLQIEFSQDARTELLVRYLFYTRTILPAPARKKPRAAKKKEKRKPGKPEKKPEKTLGERWEAIRPYLSLLPKCARLIRRFLRRTTIADFNLQISVGAPDAAKTALLFGHVNTAVFTAVALVDELFTLRVRRVDVSADFVSGKSDARLSLKVRLVPLAALAAAFNAAWIFLIFALRPPFASRKEEAGGAGS